MGRNSQKRGKNQSNPKTWFDYMIQVCLDFGHRELEQMEARIDLPGSTEGLQLQGILANANFITVNFITAIFQNFQNFPNIKLINAVARSQ